MKEFFEAIQAGRRDDVIGMLDREPSLLKTVDENGLGIALTRSQYLTEPRPEGVVLRPSFRILKGSEPNERIL